MDRAKRQEDTELLSGTERCPIVLAQSDSCQNTDTVCCEAGLWRRSRVEDLET